MIDRIILVILIGFAIIGYKRGLIQSLITLCSSVVALVLSFAGYPILNMILKRSPLYSSIYTGVFTKVESIDFGKGIQTQGNAIVSKMTWLPEFLTEQIKNNNNTAMYEVLGVTSIQEYVSTYVTNMIISLSAILLTWFLVKIILVVVLSIIGGVIEHLPIISSFNRGGGFLFGLIKGLFTLSVIGLIIPLVITLPAFQEWAQVIETSVITKWLYENNLILLAYHYFVI